MAVSSVHLSVPKNPFDLFPATCNYFSQKRFANYMNARLNLSVKTNSICRKLLRSGTAALFLFILHPAFIGCTKKSDDTQSTQTTTQSTPTTITVTSSPSVSPSAAATTSALQPSTGTETTGTPIDLNTDATGLSKSVFIMKTSKGTIKFKLYAKDAPVSSKRLAELVQQKLVRINFSSSCSGLCCSNR